MSIGLQALCELAISQPEGTRIKIRVPRQRQTVASPETATVPRAR